jgi:hypothetical protein
MKSNKSASASAALGGRQGMIGSRGSTPLLKAARRKRTFQRNWGVEGANADLRSTLTLRTKSKRAGRLKLRKSNMKHAMKKGSNAPMRVVKDI